MKEIGQKNLSHLAQPYIFVLKEGSKIQEDLLDYSLLLFQTGPLNVIRSPSHNNTKKSTEPSIRIGQN